MEKNTKILLGLGAVIAAYLILKPKKAVAQTDLVSLKKSPTSDDGSGIIDNNDGYIPKSPYMPQVRESTPEEWNAYYSIMQGLRDRQCATPMAIGYSSYFDEALGRCVTKYTKPIEDALLEMQLGNLTNWA